MAVYEVSIVAATAILGYDMFRDEPWTVAPQNRVVTGVAVTGSAVAGDAAIEVRVGTTTVAKKFNTTTGFPNRDHVVPLNAFVPGGSKINGPVVDAPITSPLNVLIIIEDL